MTRNAVEEPACGSQNLDRCKDDPSCTQAGGSWNDNKCESVCSRDNVEGCDENECESHGGALLADGTCVKLECSQRFPQLCDNKTECKEASGVWNGSECSVGGGGTSSPGGNLPIILPKCDKVHPEKCLNPSDCTNAGLFWHDDKCQQHDSEEPAPLKQTVEDFNDHRAEAWVQLGDAAWDGELNAGDLVTFELKFPVKDTDVNRYVAISLNGKQTLFIDNRSDDTITLSPDIVSLDGSGNSYLDINQSLSPSPWDVCASLGADYQGEWTIYFLTVDGNATSADLSESLDDFSYYQGWYKVKVDCTKQAPEPVLASPSQAMPALLFDKATAAIQPETIVPVTVGPFLLQPKLTVDDDDVGKTGSLFAYIYLPDSNFGIYIPGSSLTLSAEIDLSQLFPNAIYPVDQSNIDFDVYFGYEIETAIKYNVYGVRIQ